MSDPEINETIPASTTGGEATTGLSNNVSVFMPFNLTMDDMTAELFGKAVDLSGTLIRVAREIPLNALFTDSENDYNGWLKFLQQTEEDTFEGYVNSEFATVLIDEVKNSLYLNEGETYDPTNNGSEHLDASGVFPNAGTMWQNFFSIQDTVLGMFAFKILGHPGALSIISNDSTLRTEVSNKFAAALETLKGADDRAITSEESLAADVANVSGNGVSGGLSGADLNIVIQQFMNQAPERFNRPERGVIKPVPWIPGDKFYIQMHLSNNSYQLTTQTPGTHPVLMNVDYANVVAPVNNPGRPLEDGYYILEFTVGDGGSSPPPPPPPPPGPIENLVLNITTGTGAIPTYITSLTLVAGPAYSGYDIQLHRADGSGTDMRRLFAPNGSTTVYNSGVYGSYTLGPL
jgi:hypothetical protein